MEEEWLWAEECQADSSCRSVPRPAAFGHSACGALAGMKPSVPLLV